MAAAALHPELPAPAAPRAGSAARRLRWVVYFWALAIAFSALALWLLSRGYLNDTALWNWSLVVGNLDAPQGGFNRFVLLYPQVQYYLLTLLSVVPGLKSPQMPYLLSATAAAALMTHFTWRLRHIGLSRLRTGALVALVAFNPLFLWAATNGSGEMLGIALYYVLGLSLVVLRYSHSLHAHMMLGLTLLLFFITDARSVYLAITLLPLLPLVIQSHILRLNPAAPILVLYSPLLFMVGIWLALNWVYTGDPLAFLRDPASPFLGARISAEHLPWRAAYGRSFFSSTALAAVLLVACFPILAMAQLPPLRRSRVYAAALGLAGMPVLATGLATWAEFTQSPIDLLVFTTGGVMALLTTGLLMRDHPRLMAALLVLGSVGALQVFKLYPAVGMHGWLEAWSGRAAPVAAGDLALGQWTRQTPGMMLDENTGYAVIAARERADDLYLTFSDVFKQGVSSGAPRADYIAVPSALRDPWRRDQLAKRFPRLYEHGLPGYVLTYDRPDWRVYAREARWAQRRRLAPGARP